MYSALKHKGQRLYKLAHQGLEVDREPREITVHSMNLLDYRDDELELEILCSKGTYIRTLAEDIGKELGCGAHVKSLRRIGVGPYSDKNMLTLSELESIAEIGLPALDAELLEIESVLQDMPSIHLVDAVAYYLCQGQPVMVPRAPTRGMLRVYTEAGRFLGVGEVLEDGPRGAETAGGVREIIIIKCFSQHFSCQLLSAWVQYARFLEDWTGEYSQCR